MSEEWIYQQEKEHTCKQCSKVYKTLYPTKLYCGKTCNKKAALIRKRARIYEEVEQRGLLTLDEASAELGIYKQWISKNTDLIKFKGVERKFVDPTDLQRLKDKRFHSEQKKKLDSKKTVIRRKPGWDSWHNKELEYLRDLPDRISRYREKYGKDSMEHQVAMWCAGTIAEQNQLAVNDNMAVLLRCSVCHERRPYYEFNTELKTNPVRARSATCKACIAKRTKGKTTKSPTGRAKLRTLIATSAKRHMSKIRGEYAAGISVPKVWKAIEDQCGYTEEELADHLESQFTKNMNWTNQVKPKNPTDFTWQIDHVTPHFNFEYDSLDHPDFSKCWDLKNLRPMESVMNMQKGNKKLYTTFQASFRKGIIRASKGKISDKGIWRHVSYTNIEAYEYLISSLNSRDLKFESWGEKWQLDHIDPVAHLAFTSPEQENFKKCWSLNNLQPLTISENAAKSSRYSNKLWVHNYEKDEE